MTTLRDAAHIGVVGAGGIAHDHLAAWQQLGHPVTVYSVSGRAFDIADRYGATATDSLQSLIDRCEVVDICTPTTTHLPIVRRAADAGRHIICEKPLALPRADAAAIIDICRQRDVRLFAAQVVRYFPAYALIAATVAAGEIGTLHTLALSRTGPAPTPAWFHDDAASGGVLVDQMIHDFDFARLVAGPVVSVTATLTRHTDRIITAAAVLAHRGGAGSTLRGGWLGPETTFETAVDAAGAGGELRHSSQTAGTVTWRRASNTSQPDTLDVPDADVSPFTLQLADFIDAIEHGQQPRVTAQDSLHALDLALAARESAQHGGREISVEI